MSAFLESIWPDNGNYLVSHPLSSGFKQVAFANKSDAFAQAMKWSEDGKDAYFCIATVDAEGEFVSRSRSHIVEIKAFWIDIDCGEEKAKAGKGYITVGNAIAALKGFCKAIDLPTPNVVSSGYGLHCYWVLDKAIDGDSWFKKAVRFKEVLKHYGILADDSRTSDRTSILRVPGTVNHKRGLEKPVTLVKAVEIITIDQFLNPLKKYFVEHALHVTIHEPRQKDDEALAILKANGVEVNEGGEFEPADFNKIVERCASMRHAVENSDELSEPEWRSALSIAKFCEDGEDKIHEVSMKHAEYSEDACIAKADTIPGPHNCETFRGSFKQCEGCQAFVKNPMNLGRPEKVVHDNGLSTSLTIAPASDEPVNPGYEGKEGLFHVEYNYPNHYITKHKTVQFETENELGANAHKQVSPMLLSLTGRITDSFHGEDVVGVCAHTPCDGLRTFEISLRDLTDVKGGKVAGELAAVGCMLNASEIGQIGGFMSAFIRHIVKQTAAAKHYAALGWLDGGQKFVLPDGVMNSDGEKLEGGMSTKIEGIVNAMHKEGTLEAWVDVVNTYSREGYEAYAFGHSVGYGAMLMKFTQYEGAIVNMVGDSGSGKSTILQTINSMFGHPNHLMMRQTDTMLSRFQMLGVYNNICATCDEITNISPEDASNLCYSISDGRERRRLKADGTQRGNVATWKTIMATTSNSSLYERLGMNKSDADAESMRVFEYHVRTSLHSMTKQEAETTFRKLHTNFGHAGEVFVKYMMENMDYVQSRIAYWQGKFDVATKIYNKERFWSTVVACTLAGGEAAKAAGLNSFDIDALFDFAVEQVASIRSSITDNRRSSMALLVDFINNSVRNTLVIGGGMHDGKDTKRWVIQEPSNKLTVRLEMDGNKCYIDRSALRQYIVDGGSDFSHVKKELLNKRVLVNDNSKIALSDGSRVVRSGATACWVIDLNHAEMNSGSSLQIVENVLDLKKVVNV